MSADGDIPRLDELLAALRLEGVPIGPGEVVRVRHAFSTAPRLDRDELREFLACLLVKRPDHRRVFDQLFEQWCADRPATQRPPARRRSKPSHFLHALARCRSSDWPCAAAPDLPPPALPGRGGVAAGRSGSRTRPLADVADQAPGHRSR